MAEPMEAVMKGVPEAKGGVFGSLAESVTGAGAIALAIIGLAGIAPALLASIATIVIGAALSFEGGAITSRLSRLLKASSKSGMDTSALGGGITTEFLGGAVGLALGILAIVQIVPVTLTAIAAIVFGAAIVMGSGTSARLNSRMLEEYNETPEARMVAYEAIMSAAGVQTLIGLAAIALGIIAVVGIHSVVLTLVALLAVGFSSFFNGSAVTGRMIRAFSR